MRRLHLQNLTLVSIFIYAANVRRWQKKVKKKKKHLFHYAFSDNLKLLEILNKFYVTMYTYYLPGSLIVIEKKEKKLIFFKKQGKKKKSVFFF